MLHRAVASALGRRGAFAIAVAPVRAGAAASVAAVRNVTYLQGRPPVVDTNAGTFAAFYYKNIRDFDTPTKDHIVAYGQDEKFTIGAFDRQVYAYAQGLLEGLGLKKGETVAVWMTGELEHVVLQYAAALIGTTVVEIDPKLGFDQVLAIIKAENARALFLSPRYNGEDRFGQLSTVFASEFEPAVAEGGSITIASKRFRSLKHVVCATNEFEDGVVRFRDLPVYGADGAYPSDDIAAVQAYLGKSTIATIPYTVAADGKQGVRGKPLTHDDILAVTKSAVKGLGLKGTDVVVSTAPFHLPLGIVTGALAPAAVSAKTVFPNKVFDAAKTLAAATQQRATVLVTVPEHVAALNAELSSDASKPQAKRNYDVSRLRAGVVLTSGASSGPFTLGTTTLRAIDRFA